MIEKLIKGEYYYCERFSNKFIFIAQNIHNNEGVCAGLNSTYRESGKFYILSRPSEQNDNKNLRKATPKEKAWLDSCILAGKFVECPENIELTYSVF